MTFGHASFARLATFAAALVAAAVVSGSASGAPPCAGAILSDWLDNGRIDRVYPLDCYQAAIDAIPHDLRDYTDAADVIGRAFQSRFGRSLGERGLQGPVSATSQSSTPPVDATSPTSVPVPLLVLGGMSAALLAAGGVGYLSRRRRERSGLDV